MDTQNKTPKTSGTKRARTEDENENENIIPLITTPTENWPRYLVISATDPEKPLSSLSPFAIGKGIQGIAGTPKTFSKLASGDFLIEVTKRAHSQNLTNAKTLVNIPIQISPHRTLNFSKGVLHQKDLNICTEEELLQEFKDKGVTAVRCCTRKLPSGGTVKTGTFFLDFNTPQLPSHIFAGLLRIPVDPFVPNPLRCFRCQRFGHSKNRCRRQEICAKCATEGHEYENCNNEPKCINCNRQHPSSDRKCPQYIIEKEIQSYKIKHSVSFKEARQAIDNRTPGGSSGQSYATVATKDATTQKSFGCQVTPEEIESTYLNIIQNEQSTQTNEKTTQANNETPKTSQKNYATDQTHARSNHPLVGKTVTTHPSVGKTITDQANTRSPNNPLAGKTITDQAESRSTHPLAGKNLRGARSPLKSKLQRNRFAVLEVQGEKTKVSPPSKLPTPAGKHGKPPDTSGGKKGQRQPVDPKMLNRHIDLSEDGDDMDTDQSPPVSS